VIVDIDILGAVKAVVGFLDKIIFTGIPVIWRSIFGAKTIVLVNNASSPYENFWHIGSHDGKPVLQIACKFMVTNLTDSPIALAKAIWKGKIKGDVLTMLVHVKDTGSQYWGSYDIPPKARTSVGVDFIILPKKMPKNGEAVTLSIGIIDQFGNKHWVKNVDFRSA
jgi:hypothetical protein